MYLYASYEEQRMKHQVILPPPHLSTYVRHFWTIDFDGISEHDSTFCVFARRYPRLVFQHHNGNSAIYNGADKLPISYISGLNSRPYVCGIQPRISITGVSFYPSAIKLLFGVDSVELVNELPDLVNFVPRAWIDQVLDAVTQAERIQLLIAHLSKKIAGAKADAVAQFGWQRVGSSTEYSLIKDLRDLFHVSERQLVRTFRATVGMSPKQFLRITRFEKSIELMHRGKHDQSDLTHALGYADQSHFIREFKAFSNYTPLEYIKEQKLYQENSAIMIR